MFSEERHGDREEDERDSREFAEGFLGPEATVKAQILRLSITLAALAATALAGGAALKGF